MSRLLMGAASAAVLITWAGTGEPGGAERSGVPLHCTTYAAGADRHTECAPAALTPTGSTVACYNYTVGQDTHVECALMAAPRLSDLLKSKPGQVPPAAPLRCSTYHIGSSVYTDCR